MTGIKFDAAILAAFCESHGAKDHFEILTWASPPKRYTPVVYFLIKNETLFYIGSTQKFDSRIRAHQKTGKVFDNVFYIRGIEPGRLLFTEAYFIDHFRPCGNLQMLIPPHGFTLVPPKKIEKRRDKPKTIAINEYSTEFYEFQSYINRYLNSRKSGTETAGVQ